MKAIIIGRHAGEVPGIEVFETRAVTFPATATECRPVIENLIAEAKAQGAAVLFQNTPGQVAVALAQIAVNHASHYHALSMEPPPMGVGVVISVPGPRPGKVSAIFTLDDPMTLDQASAHMIATAQGIARFANPRAVVVSEEPGTVTVSVDGPPMPFEFSHIEWL